LVRPALRKLLRVGALTLVLACPAQAAAGGRATIFYYPWYGTAAAADSGYAHWGQNGHVPPADIASNFYPARGIYSSGDAFVVGAQMREIAAAGIAEVAVSWWGRGSVEDSRLPLVLSAARAAGLAVAAHLEPYDGRSVASTESDIGYLRSLGIQSFYVYRPLDLPDAEWAAMNDRLEPVRIYAQTGLVGRAAAGHFDGIYTYDILVYGGNVFARLCAQAHAKRLLCAPSVGPGYDARRAVGDARVKPRREGLTYDSMWAAALRAHADGVTITSYNEWHEGTQIEPAADRPGYASYEGAWHLAGACAQTAYLARTELWTRQLAKTSAEQPKTRASRMSASATPCRA